MLSPAFSAIPIPWLKLFDVSPVEYPSIVTLPSINVVPVGILSVNTTVVGAVPVLLSNVILYVISSLVVTFVPFSGLALLLISTFGLLN